jgi:hypothetical protein
VRLIPSPIKLLGLAVLACGLLIGVLFAKAADSYLASQPMTGRFYSQLRDDVATNFHQALRSIWGQTGENLRSLLPQGSVAAAPAMAAQTAEAAAPADPPRPMQSLHRRELGAAHAEAVRLAPYITTGLTPDEVRAILGAPSAATDGKLAYGGSEFYFINGRLTGWKLDPASAPIRVKLWPDAPVDPGLAFFAVGSSKSAVLVVQGTPTFLSENQFGYGGSIVYFQNNRVVSWKNDPSTVPLRVEP